MMRQLVSFFVSLCIAFAPQAALAVNKSPGGAPGLTNAASVSITGGTISIPGITQTGGAGNTAYTLSKSAIPFIHISSGSIAANGAISAITALNFAYPSAYCYFPANALATVLAAGWYYCTFSTTTAGVAFLDTYTSGQPVIPASPTAVTDGKGAFTGITTEVAGPSITLPANALGLNGQLHIPMDLTTNNTAGGKTPRVRWDGLGGSQMFVLALATDQATQALAKIVNRGATNKNYGSGGGISTTTRQSTAIITTIDSTASTTVVLSLQKAVATDHLVLEDYAMLVFN